MALSYRRSRFRTRLPTDRLYTRGHYWLLRDSNQWRIGLTKFAVRMLGEIVEMDFETELNETVEEGQVIGWVEGFKAVSDLYSPLSGVFQGGNPQLEEDPMLVRRDPYRQGWLFAVAGRPGAECVDAQGYADFLDGTIDRMTGRSG